jgi:hypothetical protein
MDLHTGGLQIRWTLSSTCDKLPVGAGLCNCSCTQGQRVINPHESRWFWIILIANPIVWALLSLTALLGLEWGEYFLPDMVPA